VPAGAAAILKPAEADIILGEAPVEADIILKPAEADIILVGHVLACRGRYNTGEVGGGHDTGSVVRRLPRQQRKEGVFLCLFGSAQDGAALAPELGIEGGRSEID
jgi:hypothetical protein